VVRDDRLGTKFPVELGPDLILSPHLYGWRRPRAFGERGRSARRDQFYTLVDPPSFVLYVGRGDEPIRFLHEDLAPAVPPTTRVVIVDGDRARFWDTPAPGAPRERSKPLAELGRLLDGWLGGDVFVEGAFDNLPAPWGFPKLVPALHEIQEDIVRVIERTPVHLWELFFARGHAFRWELVRGEVPLAARFPTELAADRSLIQCVADAERFEGGAVVERGGWIEAGRFRMRRRGARLDVRARLTAADVRVAFMPAAEMPGSDALPTLAGVLMAGGDNGKTEMMRGYTWSTIACLPGEAPRLAEALRETIVRWCGAPSVDVLSREDDAGPRHDDGRWVIEHDDRYMTVSTPMYRDDVRPWEVIHPRFDDRWKRPAPLAVVAEKKDEGEDALEERIRAAFGNGPREVWVVRRSGEPRVEVRDATGSARTVRPGEELDVPGVLLHPVPVSALCADVKEEILWRKALRGISKRGGPEA
jgi:hypothetical protein